MSAMVGERVLASLAMVHWIELVARALVEQVEQAERIVLTALVVLSAYAAELEHESTRWSFLAVQGHASFSQAAHAPVELLP